MRFLNLQDLEPPPPPKYGGKVDIFNPDVYLAGDNAIFLFFTPFIVGIFGFLPVSFIIFIVLVWLRIFNIGKEILLISYCLCVVCGYFALAWYRIKCGPLWLVHYAAYRAGEAREFAAYRKACAEYEALLKGWPEERERRRKANSEEARLHARWVLQEAMKRRDEEFKQHAHRQLIAAKAQKEREKQLAIEKRLQSISQWNVHFEWAYNHVKREYARIEVRLVEHYGRLPPEDVAKVFSQAFISFAFASDWRMGCLWYVVQSDPRVAAISHLLPPRVDRPS